MTNRRMRDIMDYMNIEDQLRKAAKASGLSILQMSKRADVPYQTVHGFLKSGRDVRASTVGKLCALFGLELRSVKPKTKGR